MGDNLRETLSNALGETQETPIARGETKEESNRSSETNSGDTEKEYISGVDISDIPLEIRPQVAEKLKLKASLLEKGYQPKFKEVSDFKKKMEDITKKGLSLEEAEQVIDDYAYRKRNPTVTEKKEAKKTLDALIDTVPLEQKESLKQLRTIVLEEADVQKLQQKVDKLESYINKINQTSATSKSEKIGVELDGLSSRYGKELVEKYRDDIVASGLQYNATTRQLLHAIVPAEELEQALLSKDSRQKEKQNAISSKGSGMTSMETIDTRKSSLKDILKTAMKR